MKKSIHRINLENQLISTLYKVFYHYNHFNSPIIKGRCTFSPTSYLGYSLGTDCVKGKNKKMFTKSFPIISNDWIFFELDNVSDFQLKVIRNHFIKNFINPINFILR
jgi:hypothetical protein